MKNFIIVLISTLLFTACSTSTVKTKVNDTPNLNDFYSNLSVLAEICVPAFNKSKLTIHTTERSGETISSNSSEVPLKGITSNNFNIFSVLLGHPNELTYLVVENTFQPTTYFLFKRDYTKYPLNFWSSWENPDYLFKEGTAYKFLFLSTRESDRTHDLLKIQFKNQKPLKARFKLTTMESYNNEIQSNGSVVTSKNIPSCL